jgi:hypothetical protein
LQATPLISFMTSQVVMVVLVYIIIEGKKLLDVAGVVVVVVAGACESTMVDKRCR